MQASNLHVKKQTKPISCLLVASVIYKSKVVMVCIPIHSDIGIALTLTISPLPPAWFPDDGFASLNSFLLCVDLVPGKQGVHPTSK